MNDDNNNNELFVSSFFEQRSYILNSNLYYIGHAHAPLVVTPLAVFLWTLGVSNQWSKLYIKKKIDKRILLYVLSQ